MYQCLRVVRYLCGRLYHDFIPIVDHTIAVKTTHHVTNHAHFIFTTRYVLHAGKVRIIRFCKGHLLLPLKFHFGALGNLRRGAVPVEHTASHYRLIKGQPTVNRDLACPAEFLEVFGTPLERPICVHDYLPVTTIR